MVCSNDLAHTRFHVSVADVDAIDILDEFSHSVALVFSARKLVLDAKNDLGDLHGYDVR